MTLPAGTASFIGLGWN